MEGAADVEARAKQEARKIVDAGKSTVLLCFDKSASRAAKWAQFERLLDTLRGAVQFCFIIAFILVIPITIASGRPFNTPVIVAIGFWIVLFLTVLKFFVPTLKGVFIGDHPRPTKREVMMTCTYSSLCVFSAFMLQAFGRGFNGYFQTGSYDWQRAVMVGTYSRGKERGNQEGRAFHVSAVKDFFLVGWEAESAGLANPALQSTAALANSPIKSESPLTAESPQTCSTTRTCGSSVSTAAVMLGATAGAIMAAYYY